MLTPEMLHSALEEALGVGAIYGEDKIYQYGFNSLMFVEVVCGLEEKLDVDIDLKALDSIGEDTTVDGLIALLRDAIG